MDSSVVLVERAPTLEEYRAIVDAMGWKNAEATAQAHGLANALYSVCLVDQDKVIGCGRVIGDGGIFYYVQDIAVLPSYQGRGLGRRIMDAVMGYISTHAKKGAFVGLMSTEDKASFYHKYGFKERPPNRPGMEIWVE